MVSTVTTTVTAIAVMDLKAMLAGVVTLVLILLLIEREVAAGGPRLDPLARGLTVAITGLLVTFGAIVVSRLGAFL